MIKHISYLSLYIAVKKMLAGAKQNMTELKKALRASLRTSFPSWKSQYAAKTALRLLFATFNKYSRFNSISWPPDENPRQHQRFTIRPAGQNWLKYPTTDISAALQCPDDHTWVNASIMGKVGKRHVFVHIHIHIPQLTKSARRPNVQMAAGQMMID